MSKSKYFWAILRKRGMSLLYLGSLATLGAESKEKGVGDVSSFKTQSLKSSLILPRTYIRIGKISRKG